MVSLKDIFWNISNDAFTVLSDGSISSRGGVRNNRHGTAESDEFVIDGKYLELTLCLNAWDNATSMTVLIDGEREFFITNSIMYAKDIKYALDVSGFAGKKARIILSDAGSWESVTLKSLRITDNITECDRFIKPAAESVRLDLTLPVKGGKYLNIPIEKEQNSELCGLYFDGQEGFDLFLRLAKNGRTDFVASIPIYEFGGELVRICSEDIYIPKDFADEFYKQIYISEKPVGYEMFYKEEGRPKLHFTAPHGGIGDMIGFYYYKGKYNIGYLYDPGYNNWNDNSSWAFSESEDLYKWNFDGIRVHKGFNTKRSSGGAFVDLKNASGLKCGEEEPILLFYSVERQDGQRMQDFNDNGKEAEEYLSEVSVKYSIDGGKTFVGYKNNPIFLTQGAGGHDPEVFCYEPQDKYVLIIHDKRNGKWGFDFYESKNLLDWEYMSSYFGMWETPNFYPLELDGKTYWILQQCDFGYCIGEFDGREFVAKTDVIRNFEGAAAMRNFYVNGRRILMGSKGQSLSGKGYDGYGTATLPMELSLKDTAEGVRLCYNPTCEIEGFATACKEWKNIEAADFNEMEIESGLLDIEIISKSGFSLTAGETEIFKSDRGAVRIITDETIVSYFKDGGLTAGILYVPDYHLSGTEKLKINCSGILERVAVRFLKSPYEDLRI